MAKIHERFFLDVLQGSKHTSDTEVIPFSKRLLTIKSYKYW